MGLLIETALQGKAPEKKTAQTQHIPTTLEKPVITTGEGSAHFGRQSWLFR
jgi:hypothetical protein